MFLFFSYMQTLSFRFLNCPFSEKCLFHSQMFLLGTGCSRRKCWKVHFESQRAPGAHTPSAGTTTVISCCGRQCPPPPHAQIMLPCSTVKTHGYPGIFLFLRPSDALYLLCIFLHRHKNTHVFMLVTACSHLFVF